MSKITFVLAAMAGILVAGLAYTPAHAQPLRVFVGTAGSDSNLCTFAAPCRSFNRAASVVADGGEIDVLNPGGYGSISVNKALSVQGHGFSGISPAASSASGVFVAAGAKVHLNGLIIEGEKFGSTGIVLQSGGILVVENCVVRNWNDSGIALISGAAFISDTVVSDNGGHGIYVQPPSGGAAGADLSRVQSYNNGMVGFGVFGNLSPAAGASVVDSVFVGNHGQGIYALGFFTIPGDLAIVDVKRSYIANNDGVAMFADAAGVIFARDVFMDGGWGTGGNGCIASDHNNVVHGGPPPCDSQYPPQPW